LLELFQNVIGVWFFLRHSVYLLHLAKEVCLTTRSTSEVLICLFRPLSLLVDWPLKAGFSFFYLTI